VDIDASSAEDGAAITLCGVDFFDWCASTKKRFTKVVANPPYVALQTRADLQRSVQQFLIRKTSFALRSNYWCAFCLHALAVEA
jgi:methylase of polypeptide subunit release factors